MPGTVLVERGDGVLTITLNRPAQKNAVNHDVAVELGAALDLLDNDPALSVGVLTGAGGTFCAGMDLKAFARGELPVLDGRGFGGLTRAQVHKPLIAAVEGWALGGGFELALACDLIVAAQDASFGFPEVKRGLVASEGGLLRLPRRIPYHVALRVLLTGDPLFAPEAAEHGLLAADVTAAGGALEAAHQLAHHIAANAPLALAAVKDIVRADERAAFERQDPIVARLVASADAHEGARSFAERRPPVWHGR
ncbi:crotonase/enoyl-CoA hydratase family protein [Solirubrobacter ginsenosidimutans]|uniref:Crotonase/enoyl-CoA hydratase family protein n=1 Tax=Solirubrobacter ginsenosidimutans TaxID=490573 RepID=A0A9X3MUE5_9ACTN|nr:crotonase/enoyl-CoA hydratase family protein [Solirubrobacter ginsenosidimutans]MDA0159923.1 crotonase/enoyl-CoA hydratase family protein [Solirubrobacter ginsenosidimutans]